MAIEKLNLPVGRIVWGNPARAQTKVNYTTKQPVLKDGQKVDEWVCGIAYNKAEFDAQVRPWMNQEAATLYPQGAPRDFSWKLVDGDGLDEKNLPYNKREGYAGCYVLKISTEAFAPPIYKFDNGAYRQITPEEIKTGDYVVANVTIKAHTNKSGGLYINPNAFELVGYGQEIISSSGLDAQQVFGGRQYQLPAGASAVPVSSAPQGAGIPLPQMMPTAAMPVPQQPAYGAPLPPPAHDFLQNVGVQPAYAPVQPAGQLNQPYALPQANGGVQPATGYPTNTLPGLPTSN